MKPQQAPDACDATIIPLHQLYLSIIVGVMAADKLQAVQQEFPQQADPAGRFYFVRPGTTAPEVICEYQFGPTHLKVKFATRDAQRVLEKSISYIEGLDSFAPELVKFISAGRLVAPRRAAA